MNAADKVLSPQHFGRDLADSRSGLIEQLCLEPQITFGLQFCIGRGLCCLSTLLLMLNRFRTDQGHCGACRRKWRLTDTDLCPHRETQTMSHIVESCPLTKLNGGLSRLHSADEDAVSRLTSYSS